MSATDNALQKLLQSLRKQNISEQHDEDSEVDCPHCDNPMPKRALQGHIERKHVKCPHCNNRMPETALQDHIKNKHSTVKCPHCNNPMPETALQGHIERNHLVKCPHCSNKMLSESLKKHISAKHLPASPPTVTTTAKMIGLLHSNSINDKNFNDLVDITKIFAKDGIIYKVCDIKKK